METKINKMLSISMFCILMVASSSLSAQWQQDSKYGFKIKIPTSWNKNSYMDGTDQVYDYMSADENTAVQLRAFDAGAGFTTELLAQVYEESMLPTGTKKISLDDHTTANGIPSKKGVYLIDYNGTEVGLSALYIVQKNKGYVLTALIPTSMIQQKGEELKQIVKSFSIDGFSASTSTTKQNKPSGLAGLSVEMKSNTFQISSIELSNHIDANNNAVNPTTTFNTQTPEIFAVVSYTGATQKDLVVSWIFKERNRTISSDAYNFTDKKGGVGVVSITKPNAGWPTGSYSVKFEMDGKVIRELGFTVEEQSTNNDIFSGSTSDGNSSTSSAKGNHISNKSTSGSSGITGKYNLMGRSDGKSLVEYHFIDIISDGTYWEEYSPKNSGGYVSENTGTWKVDENQLKLTQRYGGVSDSYTIKGSEIIRTSEQGTVFTFRK
ncbi:MAG: PsbP-related protein [Bacteroidota bacterium]